MNDPYLRNLLDEQQIEEFRGVFDMFDVDGDQTISVFELTKIMRTLGQNPTEEEVKKMVAEADEDGSGEIDFREFCTLLSKRLADQEGDEELIEVFAMFDTDNDNLLDAEDLKRVFIELGEDKSLDDCQLFIQMHDADQDGYLDFSEFTAAFMAK